MKWLISLLVVVLGVMWWKSQRKDKSLVRRDSQDGPPTSNRSADDPGKAHAPGVVRMLGCAHCGLHLPELDMVLRDGRYYCGEPHARLGPSLQAAAGKSSN